MLRHMPFQRASCVFLFSFAPPPPGQGWGSLGPHGQIQPYAPSKFHRTVSSRPNRSRFHMHWRTHTRHMLDTCPTHAQHMFGKPALCWRCMAVWRTATIAIHCKDKGATRIKAQHGQSKPEDNYSCHNPKTMQYSCHNPKR